MINPEIGGRKMMSRKKEALRVTVWYLLLGCGWVLLLHGVPALLNPDNEIILSASRLAVAGTLATMALLLYLVIRYRLPDTATTPQGHSIAFPVREAATMLLILAFSSTVIVASSLRLDDLAKDNARQKEAQELESIVELKANLVSTWLGERMHDAIQAGQDYDIAEHYSLELSGRASGQNHAILLDRLESILKEYGYSNVIVLDARGQHPVFADDTHAYMSGTTESLVRKAAASGNALISPLYVDDLDGDAHMDFIAPLVLKHGKKKESIGAVVFQVSVEQQLIPLIRVWPVPSRTAETLLAKSVGDRVVFLNTLRHANSKPLEYSKPLSEANLIAAMALRGEQDVREGVDYRGVPVLAATSQIKGTPWVMVAKIDQDELYGALTRQRWTLLILSLLLAVLTGGFLLFSWRQEQHIRIEQYYREMLERKVLPSHYETVLRHANDLFLLADSDGRIVDANDRATELTGYSQDELLDMHASQLRPPRAREAMDQQWQFDERGAVFETEFMRKDGTTFPVEVSARIIEVEGRKFRQGIIRDITERKRAEDELRNSERAYRTLSDNMPGLVYRVFSLEDNRMQFYNDMFTQLTGYTEDELVAGHVCSIDPMIVDEDRAGVVAEVRRAVSGKHAFAKEYRLKDKSGDIRWMSEHGMPVYGSDDALLYIDGVIFDITERKQAEQQLLDEKQFSDTLTQSLPAIFFLLDQQGNLIKWNDNLMDLSGRSPTEMAAANALDFVLDEDKPLAAGKIREVFETGSASISVRLALKEGIRHYALNGTRIETLQGVNIIGIGIDITERDQAEQIIHESEKRYRSLFESMLNGLAYCRMLYEDGRPSDFIFLEVNEAFEEQTGLKDVVGKRASEVIPGLRESDPELIERYGRVALSGKPEQFEIYVEAMQMWFSISLYSPQPEHFVAVFDVITERKQSEEAIRESRDLLRSVVENAPVRIFWKDIELRYLGCNTAFAHDAGMSHPKQVYGKDDFQMGWKDRAELYRADDRTVMQSGEPKLAFEEQMTKPGGSTAWLRTSKVPLRDANGEINGILGIYEDISAHKQAEESLRQLNRALKTLSAVNRTLVHARDEEQLWQGVCLTAVEDGGYLLAWIGYAQQDEAKSVRVMASHAVKPGYVENMHVRWDDVPEGRGPTGMAIRSGKTQYVQNIADDPAMLPWQEKALSYGYKASIALPLLEKGQTFGALTIYASEPNAFNKEAIALLEEMAGDLGYGIHMQRTAIERDHSRSEHQRTLVQLRDSLEATVQAVAATVEKRDPYTAGHQRRVSELAVAIARELGLPDDQVQGIRLAGTIHDLGKVNIPAEILSNPGKISEVEYRLIQAHPQSGYDILKDVQFPWPIADIILQHHERLDGSGYPQGLKDEQILLEAKIIAVADVVEAMSSHRPYRAGLGAERALEEIERSRGKLYEPKVVDACLSLFREKGYNLDAEGDSAS